MDEVWVVGEQTVDGRFWLLQPFYADKDSAEARVGLIVSEYIKNARRTRETLIKETAATMMYVSSDYGVNQDAERYRERFTIERVEVHDEAVDGPLQSLHYTSAGSQ